MFKALYLQGSEVATATSFDEVARLRAEKVPIWLQLFEKNEESSQVCLELLGVHPLVIEDLWNDMQIPKLEVFDDYLQIIVHRIHEECAVGDVKFDEVDVLLGVDFLVTRAHDENVTYTEGHLAKLPKLLQKGPAFVAHAVLDRIVDEYLPYVDHYEEVIDEIESDLERASRARRPGGFSHRILTLTRALQRFRRFAQRQHEIFGRLSRGEFAQIPKKARPFFSDVHDHFGRVTMLADSSREVLSGLLSVYWSMQSSHMNEIMKTLTLMSTIMLPLTFIAGVYGMNFENMPELSWAFGYPAALGLMALVAVGILLLFRARKWL